MAAFLNVPTEDGDGCTGGGGGGRHGLALLVVKVVLLVVVVANVRTDLDPPPILLDEFGSKSDKSRRMLLISPIWNQLAI